MVKYIGNIAKCKHCVAQHVSRTFSPGMPVHHNQPLPSPCHTVEPPRCQALLDRLSQDWCCQAAAHSVEGVEFRDPVPSFTQGLPCLCALHAGGSWCFPGGVGPSLWTSLCPCTLQLWPWPSAPSCGHGHARCHTVRLSHSTLLPSLRPPPPAVLRSLVLCCPLRVPCPEQCAGLTRMSHGLSYAPS